MKATANGVSLNQASTGAGCAWSGSDHAERRGRHNWRGCGLLLHIFARGKIGRCPEADLVERYVKRIGWPLRITELPDRGGKLPPPSSGAVTVMLDEKGEQLSSMEFARKLEAWRDQGVRECRFLIGAADGRSEEHTSELQSLMRISYAVLCLEKKKSELQSQNSTTNDYIST